MTYLLDSDMVNYLLKGTPLVRNRFEEAVKQNAVFVLCPVVHFEVTRYLKLKGATRLLSSYLKLTQAWKTTTFDMGDWDRASDLWTLRHQQGMPITDADLLVAVSALKEQATVVTNNAKDFFHLNLQVENWMHIEQEQA